MGDGEAVRYVRRKVAVRERLGGAVRAAYPGRSLAGVERVAGGSKKGVYRAGVDVFLAAYGG
ncbi:hypothetical protein [Streptomyces sp. SID11385]|uniref:hypothetical protein n=1 Tax=Streptomyces sp. SID11385 TaxID=2706031 RepID=UPI001945250B|nr:hypothetical protein [Streptomyces sp. SID11385]